MQGRRSLVLIHPGSKEELNDFQLTGLAGHLQRPVIIVPCRRKFQVGTCFQQ